MYFLIKISHRTASTNSGQTHLTVNNQFHLLKFINLDQLFMNLMKLIKLTKLTKQILTWQNSSFDIDYSDQAYQFKTEWVENQKFIFYTMKFIWKDFDFSTNSSSLALVNGSLVSAYLYSSNKREIVNKRLQNHP